MEVAPHCIMLISVRFDEKRKVGRQMRRRREENAHMFLAVLVFNIIYLD